ncbi:MAG TPA: NAD(P)H-dependent glycerol-3-phosphate dehydrogenase [Alphaproteobacteria bacterium]
MTRIGVIGGGAWGTALAAAAVRAGRAVTLWAREPEVVADINAHHENRVFLPGVDLPESLVATGDLAAACAADAVLLVAPAQFLRATASRLSAHWPEGLPAVICAKGIEQGSGALMSEVVRDALPQARLAVLSGPTFAGEAARGLPVAVTLACADAALGARLVAAIGSQRMRPYLSDDLVGAQVGGAVKNVMAIASGIVGGRGFGENARAALITRGLHEIVRLGVALGARMETLMGLSGAGDLMLTCMSLKSRNYSVGFALGEGRSLAEALGGKSSVAEGVFSAPAVVALARRRGVDMPICFAVDAVLNGGADIDTAIDGLLSRPFTSEYSGR